MVDDTREAYHIGRQFPVLGACWVVYGLILIAGAAAMISLSGTATLMFGALLNRVPDPFTWMNAFHIFYGTMVVFSAACGALALVTGWALLSSQRSARILAIIAAVCSLWNVPIGITLGIYTLILMLAVPPSSAAAFPAGPAPALKHRATRTA